MDLALNNQQRSICYLTKKTNLKPNFSVTRYGRSKRKRGKLLREEEEEEEEEEDDESTGAGG